MQRDFRADIQGLRAVAVGLVALDHANVGPFDGGFVGVDVFFVISGYLITSLLLREADRTGRVSLRDFYARRARRILPAALLVIVATLVLSVLFLDGAAALLVGEQAVWATFFAANIKFATDSTDYFAADRPRLPAAALLVAGGRGAVLPVLAADPAGRAAAAAQAVRRSPQAGDPGAAGRDRRPRSPGRSTPPSTAR